MSRRKTVFAPKNFYHVFNRGTRKTKIFRTDQDFQVFQDRLWRYSSQFHVRVVHHMLIPNHYHFVLYQIGSKYNISDMMHGLCQGYSIYFNRRYGLVGPVFQGRFKSKHIQDIYYLLQVSRYIHHNALDVLAPGRYTKKQAIRQLRNYKWSSYRAYLGLEKADWAKWLWKKPIMEAFHCKTEREFIEAYKRFVERPILAKEMDKMKGRLADRD